MWNQTIPDRLRGPLAGVEMLSYSVGPPWATSSPVWPPGWSACSGGSIVWGGVLCVAGTVALAAALPAFRRYNGRDGLARKIADDEAWATAAEAGPAVEASASEGTLPPENVHQGALAGAEEG